MFCQFLNMSIFLRIYSPALSKVFHVCRFRAFHLFVVRFWMYLICLPGRFLNVFDISSRFGSKTDEQSGESARSAGAAAASWPSTACTGPWCVTPSRCRSPSSTPPRTAWWDPAPPGCSVSRMHVSATRTHTCTHTQQQTCYKMITS